MKVFGDIERTPTLVTRVRRVDYKSKRYVDIRNWFKNQQKEWIPTKKGIMIEINLISGVIDLLERAEQEIKTT